MAKNLNLKFLKLLKTNILYEENYKLYYYDGMKNNHSLIKLNIQDKKIRINKLLEQKHLILIYAI